MRFKRLAIIVAVPVLAFVALVAILVVVNDHKSTEGASNSSQVIAKPNQPTRAELLKLVNQVRAKNGVAPLKENPILDKSAQWKADDEVKYNYFGHVKPGTTGNDGLDYLNSLKPPCSYIDENLAWMTDDALETAQSAMKGWMGSTPHRTAILNPKYTLTGFGIVHDAVVEHFCEP